MNLDLTLAGQGQTSQSGTSFCSSSSLFRIEAPSRGAVRSGCQNCVSTLRSVPIGPSSPVTLVLELRSNANASRGFGFCFSSASASCSLTVKRPPAGTVNYGASCGATLTPVPLLTGEGDYRLELADASGLTFSVLLIGSTTIHMTQGLALFRP